MTEVVVASDGIRLYAELAGRGPLVVLLHAGGPDHHSLLPLADHLTDRYAVALPDLRGYGRSVCVEAGSFTWDRYVDDVVQLLDALGADTAALVGTGLGGTVALRAARARPARVRAAVLVGVEDIEQDDAGKHAEIRMLDEFAARARHGGLAAAWAPILPMFPPLAAELVRDAIPRSDADSVAAAAHIGHDTSFRTVGELADVSTPVLVFPGADARHPDELGRQVARTLPQGRLGPAVDWSRLAGADGLAAAVGPAVREFLDGLR